MDQYTGSQLDAAPALTLLEQITLAFHTKWPFEF
jgi:hypothetical protein